MLQSSLVTTFSNPAISPPGQPAQGPWRPPQWSTNAPALTVMDAAGNSYVFDGEPDIQHDQELSITQNPVQTGASISDHAFLVPVRVTAEILMSDAMQSFNVGQFGSGPSRSVDAFRTMLSLQATRMPVSIATRLNTYANMLVASVRATEDQQSAFGAHMWVTFEQIIMASVQQNSPTTSSNPAGVSKDTQTTDTTFVGPVQPLPVPPSIQQNNNLANASPDLDLLNLPAPANPGTWSSSNINSGNLN